MFLQQVDEAAPKERENSLANNTINTKYGEGGKEPGCKAGPVVCTARGVRGRTLLLAAACVMALIVATVAATVRMREEAVSASGSGAPLCRAINASLLPFIEGEAAIVERNISWYYAGTIEYFGLERRCLMCYTKDSGLICSDGEKMVFGRYDEEKDTGAASGMSVACLTSSLDLDTIGPQVRSKDVILSDVADGLGVSTTYLREEFGLACTVTGGIEGNNTKRRTLQVRMDGKLRRLGCEPYELLPFRKNEEIRQVSKSDIRWIYKNVTNFFGIDSPSMVCYASDEQLLCTDWEWLIFSEYVSALKAYAVMGRTAHCISGTFDPRRIRLTERTGDIISDDYLDGHLVTEEHISENTGLVCKPLVLRRGLAASGAQCSSGVNLRKQDYRQAISSVASGSGNDVHSHAVHSITFSDCDAGYQPASPKQFGRHTGVGSGVAVGYRFHCQDAFAGNQNPLVRLGSSTGFTSSNGRLRTSYIGRPGCSYSASERRITAGHTMCDGYAIDDGVTVAQSQNTDEFWSACPG